MLCDIILPTLLIYWMYPLVNRQKNYGTSSILMAKLPVNGRVQYQTVSLSEGTFAGGAPQFCEVHLR